MRQNHFPYLTTDFPPQISHYGFAQNRLMGSVTIGGVTFVVFHQWFFFIFHLLITSRKLICKIKDWFLDDSKTIALFTFLSSWNILNRLFLIFIKKTWYLLFESLATEALRKKGLRVSCGLVIILDLFLFVFSRWYSVGNCRIL